MFVPQSLWCFLFWIWVQLSLVDSRTFTVNNNCKETIWPAYNASTKNGASAGLHNASGGWEAAPQSSAQLSLEDGWIGTIWARQVCDFSKSGNTCLTGSCDGGLNCTSPGSGSYTNLYIILAGETADTYAIMLRGGFNLPVEVKPNTPDPVYAADGACNDAACAVDFDPVCPSNFQVSTNNGQTLACKFDQSLSSWYSAQCPQVVLEHPSNFWSCIKTDYTITFCPSNTKIATPLNGETSGDSPPISSTSPISGSSTSSSGSSGAASPSSPSSQNRDSNNGHRLSPGAIAGIAVGGGSSTVVVIVMIIYLGRRRRRNTEDLDSDEADIVHHIIDPFVVDRRNGEGPTFVESGLITQAYPAEKEKESLTESDETLRRPGNPLLDTRLPEPVARGETSRSRQDSGATSSEDISRDSESRERNDAIGAPGAPDLLQLFENRVFENQLLNLISERMDRAPRLVTRSGSDDGLPEYRSAYGTN